jgi:hypothetical protein
MKTIRTKCISGLFTTILLMGALSTQGCATMRPRKAVPMDFAGIESYKLKDGAT